jgi:hypothetical protein
VPAGEGEPLSGVLIGLPRAIGLTVLANGGELLPAGGSPAQDEIDGEAEFIKRNAHPVLDTYSQVHVRLLGAMRNLVAIGHLLRTDSIGPACDVLSRTVLESAAVVIWLLGEPRNTRSRVVRGRAQHIHELEEDAGILRDVELEEDAELLGDVPADPVGARVIEEIRSTIDQIAADCEAIGIRIARTKRGRVFLPEASVPSASGGVRNFLGDNALIVYRMLCGSTHGSTNAALHSMTAAPVESAHEGMQVVMPTNDPLAVVPSLAVAIDGFMRANDARFVALGWTADDWTNWTRQAKATIVELLRRLDERPGSPE